MKTKQYDRAVTDLSGLGVWFVLGFFFFFSKFGILTYTQIVGLEMEPSLKAKFILYVLHSEPESNLI
jgi:hypothetical protein